MEIEIELPLDGHGFLRRQCPHREREFKWHEGPTEEAPADAPNVQEYYCPYCGQVAGDDQWFTDDQVEVIQAAVVDEVSPQIESMLGDAFTSKPGGLIQTSVSFERTAGPAPLVEPDDDMVAVASPCHGYEPIKVASQWNDPLHCLICGSPFAL
ncbi:MAG: hypothetical protein Q8K58_09090 [Acidimicrobiales bacterium]|nr:hypothetical protein [Acidimicrobiales bacterium]